MKINLLGIAYDEKSSFLKGPALAPPIIRQTMYSPAYNFTAENGLDIEKDISIIDKGDISIQKYTELKIKLAQLITDKTPSIFLGGDHSITYPIIDIL
ncbi:MAG TPA: agmatinase, partial [Saprospiraceae bacterium]|nr:agmatinase [Saprospiraceae bacterium]